MKTIIKERRCDFRVAAEGMKFYIEVYIEVSRRVSLRFSFINNLNAILSEFGIGVDDKIVSESQ